MKKNKRKVIRFFLFIAILVTSFNSYADTFEEEKKFILSLKLPLIPEVSIMQISTKLSNTNNEIYKLNFNVKTINLIDYISSVNGNGYTEGFIKNSFYIPEYYKYDYVRKSKNKSVSIKYLNGKIQSLGTLMETSFTENDQRAGSDSHWTCIRLLHPLLDLQRNIIHYFEKQFIK